MQHYLYEVSLSWLQLPLPPTRKNFTSFHVGPKNSPSQLLQGQESRKGAWVRFCSRCEPCKCQQGFLMELLSFALFPLCPKKQQSPLQENSFFSGPEKGERPRGKMTRNWFLGHKHYRLIHGWISEESPFLLNAKNLRGHSQELITSSLARSCWWPSGICNPSPIPEHPAQWETASALPELLQNIPAHLHLQTKPSKTPQHGSGWVFWAFQDKTNSYYHWARAGET